MRASEWKWKTTGNELPEAGHQYLVAKVVLSDSRFQLFVEVPVN